MLSSFGSGLLGLVRLQYVNHLFGVGVAQDAYRAAFKLPDLLSYFLTGGAVAISLITILNRYRERGVLNNGEPDNEGADRALNVILTTMFVVLVAGVFLAEIAAPWYVWFANAGFRTDPVRAHLCTALTRVILPGQLFFFIGSCLSARLQVRKIFLYQAAAPLIYNLGIVGGAFFLHNVKLFGKPLGVYSLAIGVVIGVVCGPFLLNSIGAFRTGLRYKIILGFRDPAFLEWFKLTLPLMIGVSLVMFDGYFLYYFASKSTGGITLIGNAKDLFNAPFNVIGPAAGAASLPFFAALFQQHRAYDFSASVGRSVSRLFAVGMLVSAWMIALAPWLMDLFRSGKFNRADVLTVTQLFQVLAITLAVWAVQGIYARAFYAASDTRTPAITGTVITILSVPLYWVLFKLHGLTGLAIASDTGIVIQTATLAFLLHRKRLVSLAHLEFAELARAIVAALLAFVATYSAAHALLRALPTLHGHKLDLLLVATGSTAWALTALLTLVALRSKLPAQLLRRKSS
jgi:putative peptidoglycan lipid II flippase